MSVADPTPKSDVYSFGGIMWQVRAAPTFLFETAIDSVIVSTRLFGLAGPYWRATI